MAKRGEVLASTYLNTDGAWSLSFEGDAVEIVAPGGSRFSQCELRVRSGSSGDLFTRANFGDQHFTREQRAEFRRLALAILEDVRRP